MLSKLTIIGSSLQKIVVTLIVLCSTKAVGGTIIVIMQTSMDCISGQVISLRTPGLYGQLGKDVLFSKKRRWKYVQVDSKEIVHNHENEFS